MASTEEKSAPQGDNVGHIHEPGTEEAFTSEIKETIQNVDHDDAADLFAGSEEVFEYTDKEATWVRWKLDLILLSMVRDSQRTQKQQLTVLV
jgi:MFS transporter, ACS family, allantoate permease